MDSLIKPFSYSSITKTNKSVNNEIIDNISNDKLNGNTENTEVTMNEKEYEIEEEPIIRNTDKVILYYYPNIYTKKKTIEWLGIKIDTNFYHYDYCLKLFELLMKWVRINGFYIRPNEHVLLAKFCSLMYFLSNKRGYNEISY